jgi:hypothetical protein
MLLLYYCWQQRPHLSLAPKLTIKFTLWLTKLMPICLLQLHTTKKVPGEVFDCGCDLFLSEIKVMDKQVLFVMCSGSVVAFPAKDLMHGVTQHGHVGVCGGRCHASADNKQLHISFAVYSISNIIQERPWKSINFGKSI